MKNTILSYGLIGGLFVGTVLSASTVYYSKNGAFDGGMVLGYAAMILAFSLIFVALKNIRDKQNGGFISFGKAFKAALLITLVTSTVYVLVWLICYYAFIPDFMEKYTAYTLHKAKEANVSAEEFAKQKAQMDMYAGMYKNPLYIIGFTYMEIVPVGLIVSLIAALIIKRKKNAVQPGMSLEV